MATARTEAERPGSPDARRALRRLLVDAVQQRSPSEAPDLSACSARQVLAAADRHRVAPAVYLLVREADLPPEWGPPLAHRYEEQLLRRLSADADLAVVARVLGALGAPWVVMKGPVLADCLWPRPDMRQYLDLDVVVDRRRFEAGVGALIEAGARLVDRNWPLIRHQMRAELSLELPYGTGLDLHWDLVNDAATRARWRLPLDVMLERSVVVTVGGVEVPTFDAPDTLLSVAHHAALAGATRLLWLKDMERAAAVDALAWGEVDRRARSTGSDLMLTMALDKAWRVLGVRPSHPDWRPRRSAWGTAAAAVDRAFPSPGLAGDRRTGQVLYLSARRSTGASAAAAWNALRRPPAPPTAGVPGTGGTDTRDADPAGGVNPLHVAVESPADRAAYFEALSGREVP